ncbi:MAG: hypothetical protein F6K18_23915 [Okeania sp. SIO2C2]|uniref:hypothetical protein n=1 Tax=Okeania sp. SIO2C2 TaxID=2607787 RepID=UPI0013B81466|nr:hypothetical protein [Okeania sp. SIO2C2]NEP89632.1 hypothetical protein [Okeania sp. SIO2C2]
MRNPFIKFIKIASITISTILSYSTIDINSAQAANNNASEFFLTAQATQADVKIDPTTVIGDVINSKANNEAIAVTKLLILLLQNSNLELKFLYTYSQTDLMMAKVGNWKYSLNPHQETSQTLIDQVTILGVGLISISYLLAKKRP